MALSSFRKISRCVALQSNAWGSQWMTNFALDEDYFLLPKLTPQRVRRFALLCPYNALIVLKMLRNASSHPILRPAKISLDRRQASVSWVCGQALSARQ